MNKNVHRVGALAAMMLGLMLSTQALARPTKIPDSKIAIIYSEMFMDGKTGIARYGVIVDSLNREFQSRQTELRTLQQKAQALNDEITKTQPVADPKTIAIKLDQLDQMKKDLQRKSEDAQAAYDERKKEVFTPLQNDIGKALEAYAKSNNISIIIDGSQVPLAYATDAVDITRAFINDFNSKNPVTTTTPPK